MSHNFARWIFETFIKKHTTIDFKRSHGGQEIKAQIRIFGWMVAEETILKKKEPGK